MSQPESPKLSLGDPPGRLKRQLSHTPRGWLILLAAMQAAAIGCLVALSPARPGGRAGPGRREHGRGRGAPPAPCSNCKTRAWTARRCLPGRNIWKPRRIQRSGLKSSFKSASYTCRRRSLTERLRPSCAANRPPAAMRCGESIAPHLMTCLRRLGLYGEVGRELTRQVEVGAEKQERGQVLATLDGEPITDSDLDRMTERRVDQMLSMQEAADNESARKSLLEQLSRPERRQRLLEELLQTELMVRRSRPETGSGTRVSGLAPLPRRGLARPTISAARVGQDRAYRR